MKTTPNYNFLHPRRIATRFLLGFDENVSIKKHNFRQLDALPYAKERTLEEKLDKIFGK